MKQGAIFDMDGLMFDTERLYQESWREVAREMGIDLPMEFTREISGSSGDRLNQSVIRYYHTEEPQALFQRVIKGVEKMLEKEVPLKPGIVEILSWLKDQNVKLAVASSSNIDIIRSNLRNSGTEKYFDAVISGYGLERGKPLPDIFLKAAEAIAVPPEDCYVFEDSINGVLAGLAAGSETIMVPDYVEPNETIRSSQAHICSSLLETLEEIKAGTF